MPTLLTPAQARLNNIKTSSMIVLGTLELLANASDLPFLKPITLTACSLLNLVQSVNKNKCIEIMEQVYEVIHGIIRLHVQSETGQLSLNLLKHIAEFAETLYKVHTFVQAQQETNKFKQILRRGEMNALLRTCTSELQQALSIFRLQGVSLLIGARQTHEYENQVHQEVLHLIDSQFNEESSDGASTIPQINQVFSADHNRFFVSCESALTKVELTILIGAHLGLKGSKDLTQALIQHFSHGPLCLLVLDNLETLWEQVQFQGAIEELLSLLAEVEHLALIVTMRGAIADDVHNAEDVDKVLLLTGNVPLAIDLLARLVASDGCINVLSRWEEEATAMISQALIRTSLAYQDKQKRLRVLVPIQEYMQQYYPPTPTLTNPLLSHFQELLKTYTETSESQEIASRIIPNFANIQNLLSPRLKEDNPDLMKTIDCTLVLANLGPATGWGNVSLVNQIPGLIYS
ncbi:hypothetical protein B0H16DRAFT_1479972 [Mycena metata]|uniref:Uncharacterized protein n=1 Tax=Mycena metata TaxID=1033252 RepID=A0AAD7H470_9AGAR|nr:hypothetical protein B0H16DRAFT_1479972 [Mycena metata]